MEKSEKKFKSALVKCLIRVYIRKSQVPLELKLKLISDELIQKV